MSTTQIAWSVAGLVLLIAAPKVALFIVGTFLCAVGINIYIEETRKPRPNTTNFSGAFAHMARQAPRDPMGCHPARDNHRQQGKPPATIDHRPRR